MIVWIDAQLSPALADWMTAELGIEAHALRDLGLRDAADREIFDLARAADAVIFTKDSDFLPLLEQHGPPPRVLWLTIGNTSNARVREVLIARWARVSELFDSGEVLVEIQSRDGG